MADGGGGAGGYASLSQKKEGVVDAAGAAFPGPFLFLDVDGVLNSQRSRSRVHEPGVSCDEASRPTPEKLALLADLVAATGARVVVSSTWRASPPDFAVLRLVER